jgi:hypothetical protein
MNANPEPNPRRLFLFENGWRIELKAGSDREFCYMTAPGQNHYHRLLDGEIYLARGDEKLCLACAERRGLLSYEPRQLRDPVVPTTGADDDPESPGR